MPVLSSGAPYVTAAILANADTGIAWTTMPGFNSSTAAQTVNALNLATRASAAIDSYCETTLRATINTETVYGPGDERCALKPDGTARLIVSRPGIIKVISGSVTMRASFPKGHGRVIPGDMMYPERPPMGIYGSVAPGAVAEPSQAIIVAPGFLNPWGGRQGTAIEVTYINGYPHTQLTAAASRSAQTVEVDDITGMLVDGQGAFCTLFSADDAVQEAAAVDGVTPATAGQISGPGTLHLSAPLAYNHAAGDLFTTLPASVQEAAILYASSYALKRGATASNIPSMGGGRNVSAMSPADLANEAELLIFPFRRTW